MKVTNTSSLRRIRFLVAFLVVLLVANLAVVFFDLAFGASSQQGIEGTGFERSYRAALFAEGLIVLLVVFATWLIAGPVELRATDSEHTMFQIPKMELPGAVRTYLLAMTGVVVCSVACSALLLKLAFRGNNPFESFQGVLLRLLRG
jgi:hypothetical protein